MFRLTKETTEIFVKIIGDQEMRGSKIRCMVYNVNLIIEIYPKLLNLIKKNLCRAISLLLFKSFLIMIVFFS